MASDGENKNISLKTADGENNIYNKPRTTPCLARYVYPKVSFNCWLYNCSQSRAPNFRNLILGNLNKLDFWKLFYNYQVDDFKNFLFECKNKINKSVCRCDRKEHIVNQSVINNEVFDF